MTLLDKTERRCKQLRWRILAKMRNVAGRTITTSVQGHRMTLDLLDRVHCETLYVTGRWEEEITNYLRRILRQGMTVVDLGANVGFYTLLAAKIVGPSGKVYAFEPEPSRYALLARNIVANGYTNVLALNKAVSNTPSRTSLYLDPRYNPAGHQLHDATGTRRSVLVETVSLDGYFSEGATVDVIKMDIQGAEMLALQGMERLLQRSRPLTLVTEFWPDGLRACGSAPEEFLFTLQRHGFMLSVFDPLDGSLMKTDADTILRKGAGEIYLVCTV